MVEIIPAILEKSISGIKTKLARLEDLGAINWAQLDVMDGKFVPNTTWNNPADLATLTTSLKLEIHLMVENPVAAINDWLLLPNVQRLLVHEEALVAHFPTRPEDVLAEIILKARHQKKAIGLALNPATDINLVKRFLMVLDMVLVMGVDPGFSGQEFKLEVIRKVSALRKLNTKIKIAVDGGVNLKTAPALVAAGATHLCLASYLWGSPDLNRAVTDLINSLNAQSV